MPSSKNFVLIITGPTASGKTALSIKLAQLLNGVVINADSSQVYRELRIITNRPSPREESKVPHRLFGVLSATERGSAGWWRDAAVSEIDAVLGTGQMPILCGGTGMYINTLIHGIARVPPVENTVFEEAAARYQKIGCERFKDELLTLDPVLGPRVRSGDSQRLQRAWAVAISTGKPLSYWQAQPAIKLRKDLVFCRVLLFPSRHVLFQSVKIRYQKMIEKGAVDEVKCLAELNINSSLPAMRAIGVPQLINYIEAKTKLPAAIESAVTATQQYIKRQRTWFSNKFQYDIKCEGQCTTTKLEQICEKIMQWLLTQ
ncbi:tRNA (adenosine(37)-N6)-dimethylallyltransferase MiaA [Candidatus Endolissoclinum faulkneri]|nr:tRNA (adenosine(37)-N6)-dimethylallyltransferase MiaA [Candidatus Endolissoclinum faulkneri]